jgi:hypothetical protein
MNEVASTSVELNHLLDHLDRTCIPLEEFGCFIALSEDQADIFTCPMLADGSPEPADDVRHLNWAEVTAPNSEFVERVNALFGTAFDWRRFAGR